MAITWSVTVSELGANSGNYNVSAQVTDDTKPVGRQTETVSVQGRMDTQAQKDAIYATLKQQYTALVAKSTALATLEAAAKTALEK